MRLNHLLLFCITATLPIAPTLAFASHRQRRTNYSSNNVKRDILSIRGGDINSMSSTTSTSALSLAVGPATEALRQALVSGSPLRAIGALYAVSSLTVVPLTWYRTAYSFSVGYGLSVAAMAVALLSSFTFTEGTTFAVSKLMTSGAPTFLATTALIYGVRLAAFIFIRQYTVEEKRKQFDSMNTTPALKRTPLALGVSLLYAFMMAPALFAFRGTLEAGSTLGKLQVFFANVAAFGMILETVADQHKFEVKRQNKKDVGSGKFVGPTTWSYKICRHPNYLGEILHWAGLFAAGCTTFGTSATAWVSGLLGLLGILSIMLGSSVRLDKKQLEKYGGQAKFDEWKGSVGWSVIPFIK